MKSELNPYHVLGLLEGASREDIDLAFERLRKRLVKSDKLGSAGAPLQLEQVTLAYDLLSDNARRSAYESASKTPKHYMPYSLRITPSRRIVEQLPESQVIYLLLDVIADPTLPGSSEKRDAGLNLTLILDQSNSMKGARLERVKVAASEIINLLSETDYLSVVGFNNKATVLIEATPVENKKLLASRTRMARAKGATSILEGMRAGLNENRKNLDSELVNHVILLTDGKTYGDEEECMRLASIASREGISISTLGLGSDWNDKFLDDLASVTGGASGFIKSANSVVAFMNSQVDRLSRVFAERLQLTIAADMGIDIEMAFKIKPSPQPLPTAHEAIQLGGMQRERPISVLLQVQLPPDLPLGFQRVARFSVTGDIMADHLRHIAITDLDIEVVQEAEYDEPPDGIIDALGKLTLYNMQERATQALEEGDIEQATQRLKNLATRLMDMGHDDLANQTLQEISKVQRTSELSDEGRKTIKYQTRLLISPDES